MTIDTTRLRALHALSGHAWRSQREPAIDELLEELPALLDEVDRLREALGLAYPRALQAAADVVLNADISLFDDEASGLGWLDDVANCICDLTEEQIEARDARGHVDEGG